MPFGIWIILSNEQTISIDSSGLVRFFINILSAYLKGFAEIAVPHERFKQETKTNKKSIELNLIEASISKTRIYLCLAGKSN